MSRKFVRENNLSEKLSSLIQAKPSVIESDDEDFTQIDKLAVDANESDYSADELNATSIRKRNSGFLDENDVKYCGKAVSRKDLPKFTPNKSFSSTEGSEESDQNTNSESENDEEDESKYTEDEEDEEEEQEDEYEKTEDREEGLLSNLKNKNYEIKDFRNDIIFKTSDDVEKGKAIKNQIHIWDFFLECRMKFHQSLVASNQFPNYQNLKKFKIAGGCDINDATKQTQKSLKHLLESFLALQKVLLIRNEDYCKYSNSSLSKASDSEIDSDTDCETQSEKEKKTTCDRKSKLDVFKNLNDFSLEIKKRHEEMEEYRNSIIQKWNNKTKLGSISNKNFSAFEQSTINQIKHALLDKQRLITRTQTKRSSYHILGEVDDEEPPNKKAVGSEDTVSSISESKKKCITCKEIFDDDDFYHQLLSELIKRKANDLTDPMQLGKHWTQLQHYRSKIKKTVDTKASKGRKVRFVVHPKLVNFMMPMDISIYNEESRLELLNSLFGKNRF